MKYSQLTLTDYNIDGEVAILIDWLERNSTEYTEIDFKDYAEELDGTYNKQINNGKEEWVKKSNAEEVQKGQLAYEFGNGFIILDYKQR